ncbi:DUF2924 domain-containing protein [bacterium AH-315-P15]|nr:DUF2924 domain-containing protein [bacterium AH-315-P15]
MSKEFDRLEEMNPSALRKEWRRVYGTPPPNLRSEMMRLAISYKLQEQSRGGLSKVAQSKLAAFAESRSVQSGKSSAPRPGTRLIREWGGRTHVVNVMEAGFEYGGRSYPSLSGIAREITGARWSGPRFFGLVGGAATLSAEAM